MSPVASTHRTAPRVDEGAGLGARTAGAQVDGEQAAEEHVTEELLVEEISIDGMCGVY